MHPKDRYCNSKVSRVKHTSSTRKSSRELLKKIVLPKSASRGSYDLNPFLLNDSNDFSRSTSQPSNNNNNNTNDTTTSSDIAMNTLTSSSDPKKAIDNKNDNDKNSNIYGVKSSFSSTGSVIEIPKKRTCLGFPILCLAYFAAIYSLLAYGSSSLLSIMELILNNSTKLLPLYILLVGYLLITLMSFLLIVAIQKDLLNLIIFWLIVMSLFIIPEVGLNFLLAETSFVWFNSSTGFYTLVFLVIRVSIDIPCIAIIVLYFLNKSKRKKYLNNMLKPLQENIINGEVLKQYNNLKLDQTMAKTVYDQKNQPNKFPAFVPMPHREHVTHLINASEPPHLVQKKLQTNPNRVYYRFQNPENNKITIQVKPSQTNSLKHHFVNVGEIKMSTAQQNQKFNFDMDNGLVPFDQLRSFKSDVMTSSSNSNDPSGLHLVWGINGGENGYARDRPILAQYGHVELENPLREQMPIYQNSNFVCNRVSNNPNSGNYDNSEDYECFQKKDVQLSRNLSMSISKAELLNRHLAHEKPKINFDLNHEQYKSLIKRQHPKTTPKNINWSNHQIYLPQTRTKTTPLQSGHLVYSNNSAGSNNSSKGYNLSFSTAGDGRSPAVSLIHGSICNCVNIASCSNDRINDFIHSNDCQLASLNQCNNKRSLTKSKSDYGIQREHF